MAEEPEAIVEVMVRLPAHLYNRTLTLARTHGWPHEEAVLTVLSHGLTYLEARFELRVPEDPSRDLRAEAERWLRYAMDLHGANAVLKFRTFEQAERLKVLEMKLAGLEGETSLARLRLARFRDDERRLIRELEQLRQENEALRAALKSAGESAQLQTADGRGDSILRRLRGWVRRSRERC